MSALGSASDNVIITDKWIPQHEFLQRASIFITHGGLSSVRESIEHEVPMLVIPFDADQPGNAARVVYHHLGLRVFPNQMSGAELVELCEQIYASPRYRENLREMKHEFECQRARQPAAELIESLLHPRPDSI
jgi:zeaxanthin glucosyltransferase